MQQKRFCEEINRLKQTCFNTLKSYHLYFQISREDAWQQDAARRPSYVSQVIWSSLIHSVIHDNIFEGWKGKGNKCYYNIRLHFLIN